MTIQTTITKKIETRFDSPQIKNSEKIIKAIDTWVDNGSPVTKVDENRSIMVFIYYNSKLVTGQTKEEALASTKQLNEKLFQPLDDISFKKAVTVKGNIRAYAPDRVIKDLKPSKKEIDVSCLYQAEKKRQENAEKAEINDKMYLELMKNVIRLYFEVSTIYNVIYRHLPKYLQDYYPKPYVKTILRKNGFTENGVYPELHSGMLSRYEREKQANKIIKFPYRSTVEQEKALRKLYMARIEERKRALEQDGYEANNEAKKLLAEGKRDLLILGGAGSGKTKLINDFLSEYPDERANTLIVAPTAIAADEYWDGHTIHSSLAFNLDRRAYSITESTPVPDILLDVEGRRNITRIIIDEIGMVRVDIMEKILQIFKKIRKGGRHVQLVCVGDFAQIKPVVTNKDKKIIEEYGGIYAYNAPSWSEYSFKVIGLYNYLRLKGKDEVTRKYKEVMYAIKYGQTDGIDWLNSNIKHEEDWSGIFICGTHEMVDHYNSKYVMDERFREKLRLYKAKIKGTWKEKDRPVKDKLFLAPGMRVMATVNSSDHTYKNGYRGRITKMENDGVWVFFPKIKAEVFITYHIFRGNHRDTYEQLPLAIAKAVTIHSIQGQTIHEVVNVVGPFFESGQLYVALTRVTRVSNLRIIGMLKPVDIITDLDAMKWAT